VKTGRLFLTAAMLLTLTGCELLLPAPPPVDDPGPDDPGLTFNGVRHEPLGGATLAVREGELVVANVDGSAKRGVRVEAHGLQAVALGLDLDLAQRGRVQVGADHVGTVSINTLSGVPSQTIKAEPDQGTCCTAWEFTPDFFPLGARTYTAKVYVGDQLDTVNANLKGTSTFTHSLPVRLAEVRFDVDSPESINCCAIHLILVPNVGGVFPQEERIVLVPEGVADCCADLGAWLTLKAALFSTTHFTITRERLTLGSGF